MFRSSQNNLDVVTFIKLGFQGYKQLKQFTCWKKMVLKWYFIQKEIIQVITPKVEHVLFVCIYHQSQMLIKGIIWKSFIFWKNIYKNPWFCLTTRNYMEVIHLWREYVLLACRTPNKSFQSFTCLGQGILLAIHQVCAFVGVLMLVLNYRTRWSKCLSKDRYQG